jgi:hypothetical protein
LHHARWIDRRADRHPDRDSRGYSSLRISFEGRLNRLEQSIRKCQRDATATLVIMRATVGHFNKRLGAVEGRLTALEAPKS